MMILSSLLIFNSCEEDEVEISGDSELLVVNESPKEYGIYFDSEFLGDVDAGKTRSWSVPSGEHTLKCKCRGLGNDLSDTYYFGRDETIILRIFEEKSTTPPVIILEKN